MPSSSRQAGPFTCRAMAARSDERSPTASAGSGSGSVSAAPDPPHPSSAAASNPDSNCDSKSHRHFDEPAVPTSSAERSQARPPEARPFGSTRSASRQQLEPSEWRRSRKVSREASGKPPTSVNKSRPDINYWNYKQTGIKSRPIKLLEHPIEHIERKIIITYLLSFLFKLIAILTGPLIVLVAYLITVPLAASRRLTWYLLNSSLTCDARIKTSLSSEDLSSEASSQSGARTGEAADWSYCPLSYIESYWLKERLVNTVVLVLDNRKAPFSLDKLRRLLRERVLSDRLFRKFSCRVQAKGVPFCKSYYWRHIEFTEEPADERKAEPLAQSPTEQVAAANASATGSLTSSLQTVVDQFSVTSIVSSSNSDSRSSERKRVEVERNCSEANSASLSGHIFVDSNLPEVSLASVRRYVHSLLDAGLNMGRPLWELRAIPSPADKKTYLVFRCHQSLADGRSLSKILTDCLSVPSEPSEPESGQRRSSKIREQTANSASGTTQVDNQSASEGREAVENELEDENELKPIKEKPSFVARMSRSNSWRSAIFVGPLTVMLWVVWTFTRRKHNHLNRCLAKDATRSGPDHSRFYMAQYSLTKFHQIKQMTRSTVNDVILCALSGALRDYLRKFNGVTNPPNLNISLIVDMRQPEGATRRSRSDRRHSGKAEQQAAYSSSQLRQQPDGCGRRKRVANQVSCALVNVPLPTSVYGAVPRLWDVRNTMDELRTSADPWVMLGLQRFLFNFLPVAWYQWAINYISLRNSSMFVSNLQGPETRVEAWCVDLLQRAVFESQQPACAIQPQSITDDQPRWWPDQALGATGGCESRAEMQVLRKRRRNEQSRAGRLKLLEHLGSVTAIYYCMQPPTSNIPISFNCISYHDQLFITSLSRSLLVEDSKLLIRLFFRQLDQLADTIAKRRSLVTIIRPPVPIEISCQPASPIVNREFPVSGECQFEVGADDDDVSLPSEFIDEEREPSDGRATISPAASGVLFGAAPKDDIEANLGGRTNKCSTCDQSVCSCRRRKSLFNFDYNKQRAVNLLSLLHPAHFIAMKTSKSQDGSNQLGDGELASGASECVCGKQLLELDQGGGVISKVAYSQNDRELARRVPKSLSIEEDNSERADLRQSGARACCAECRLLAAQSSLSLDAPSDQKKKCWVSQIKSKKSSSSDQNIKNSNLSIDFKRASQLKTPRKDRLNSKQHSRSETDLLPSSRGSKLCQKAIQQQRSIVVVKDEVSK